MMLCIICQHWSRIGVNEFSHNDFGKPLFVATQCNEKPSNGNVGRLVNDYLYVVLISWLSQHKAN